MKRGTRKASPALTDDTDRMQMIAINATTLLALWHPGIPEFELAARLIANGQQALVAAANAPKPAPAFDGELSEAMGRTDSAQAVAGEAQR